MSATNSQNTIASSLGRPMHYRLDDHTPVPCSSAEAAALLANDEARRVAIWRLLDHKTSDQTCAVSTVFLVIDHAWQGPPLLFETMVFGGPFDGTQERYSTWERAAVGHQAAVALVRFTLGLSEEP